MINVYNNAASKNSAILYTNAAAAEAVIAAMEVDPYTTYRAVENNAGRFVIVAFDEDGYELGAI